MFTHKLPLLIIFILLLPYVAVSRLAAAAGFVRSNYVITSNAALIVGIVGALLVIQCTLVTELIQSVTIRSRDLLSTESVQVSPPLVSSPPTEAVPPDGGVMGILQRRGYWISLLAVGGFAWVVVAYRRFGNRTTRLLLVCNSILVVLLAISVAGLGGPPALRITSFIEPALIPVIALAFGSGLASSVGHRLSLPLGSFTLPSPRVALTTIVLILLFITQIFTPAAIPGYPGNSHPYTTAEEISAKSFTYEYVDGPIYSDWFTSISKAPDCSTPGGDSVCFSDINQGTTLPEYRPIGIPLLSANVTEQEYSHILFRTDVIYHRTNRGEWKLVWDPERSSDRDYNRVYANGGAVLYRRPSISGPVDGKVIS